MRVKLIASAAGEPDTLYAGVDGAEAFEFARAASRLFEMRSVDYLALPHGRESGSQAGDLGGIAGDVKAEAPSGRTRTRRAAWRAFLHPARRGGNGFSVPMRTVAPSSRPIETARFGKINASKR